jgi:hypothetical protein
MKRLHMLKKLNRGATTDEHGFTDRAKDKITGGKILGFNRRQQRERMK